MPFYKILANHSGYFIQYYLEIFQFKIKHDCQEFQEKIFSIIVTYANRGHYVSNLCARLFEIGINRIILIDNNSDPESAALLDELCIKYSSRIIIQRLNRNSGTAYAFKSGMEIACNDSRCDFIWIS